MMKVSEARPVLLEQEVEALLEGYDIHKEAIATKEEVLVQAGYINKVAWAPYDLLLLLDPPLVVKADAIQEAPMQNDHLAIVEEEKPRSLQSRYRPLTRVRVAPSS